MQPLPEEKKPALDLAQPELLHSATLAMGCFWGSEALFGAQTGVIRTRVGYAGGTTPTPSSRAIGDHLEVVQLEFDPTQVSFPQLLELFFTHHSPTAPPRKRQYASALFFHTPDQEKQIKTAVQEVEKRLEKSMLTEVIPYQNFFLAEERHQKWKLRREPELLLEMQKHYPHFEDFNHSTAVTRLNGYLAGEGQQENLLEELGSLGLSYSTQNKLLAHFLALGRRI